MTTAALLFPSLGMPELLVILIIVLVLFGASRLGDLGKGLGEGIRNFKKGMSPDAPGPDPAAPDEAAAPGEQKAP